MHVRCLLPYVSVAGLPGLLRNIHGSLALGGYVEFLETVLRFDTLERDAAAPGQALTRWSRLLGGRHPQGRGRDALSPLVVKRHMAAAGFVNISERKMAVPLGPWAKGRDQKIMGALQRANGLRGMRAITQAVFTKALGWTEADADAILAQVYAEMNDKRVHCYCPMYVNRKWRECVFS